MGVCDEIAVSEIFPQCSGHERKLTFYIDVPIRIICRQPQCQGAPLPSRIKAVSHRSSMIFFKLDATTRLGIDTFHALECALQLPILASRKFSEPSGLATLATSSPFTPGITCATQHQQQNMAMRRRTTAGSISVNRNARLIASRLSVRLCISPRPRSADTKEGI